VNKVVVVDVDVEAEEITAEVVEAEVVEAEAVSTQILVPPAPAHNFLLEIYPGTQTGKSLKITSLSVEKLSTPTLPKVQMVKRRALVPFGLLMRRMLRMPLSR